MDQYTKVKTFISQVTKLTIAWPFCQETIAILENERLSMNFQLQIFVILY